MSRTTIKTKKSKKSIAKSPSKPKDKWIYTEKGLPPCCQTVLFTNGEKVFFGWLETYEFGEDIIFYAVADEDGKGGFSVDSWPENVIAWMHLPKAPKLLDRAEHT